MRTMGSMRWVEGLGAIEHRQGDVVALEPLAPPGERLVDDVLQEALAPARLLERAAFEDAIQLLNNGLLVGFAPHIERNYRHAGTPIASVWRPFAGI